MNALRTTSRLLALTVAVAALGAPVAAQASTTAPTQIHTHAGVTVPSNWGWD